MTLRTLNYGNYGILLIMGNAGFCLWGFRVFRNGGCFPGAGFGVQAFRTNVTLIQRLWFRV